MHIASVLTCVFFWGRVAANFSPRANFCVPSFYPTAIFCFHFSRFNNNISEFFSHTNISFEFFSNFSIYGSRSNRKEIISDKEEKEIIFLIIYIYIYIYII